MDTHIHKNSNFLVVTISVGLAPNTIMFLCITDSYHKNIIIIMLYDTIKGTYNDEKYLDQCDSS